MSVDSVKAHLERFGVAERMRFLPGSIATVELAAAALGVEPDRIAKTLGNCIEATLEELELWTGGSWVDVCR